MGVCGLTHKRLWCNENFLCWNRCTSLERTGQCEDNANSFLSDQFYPTVDLINSVTAKGPNIREILKFSFGFSETPSSISEKFPNSLFLPQIKSPFLYSISGNPFRSKSIGGLAFQIYTWNVFLTPRYLKRIQLGFQGSLLNEPIFSGNLVHGTKHSWTFMWMPLWVRISYMTTRQQRLERRNTNAFDKIFKYLLRYVQGVGWGGGEEGNGRKCRKIFVYSATL